MKHQQRLRGRRWREVTPHTGVRIETKALRPQRNSGAVTPHTGVRIETLTLRVRRSCFGVTSHAGCGFKRVLGEPLKEQRDYAPTFPDWADVRTDSGGDTRPQRVPTLQVPPSAFVSPCVPVICASGAGSCCASTSRLRKQPALHRPPAVSVDPIVDNALSYRSTTRQTLASSATRTGRMRARPTVRGSGNWSGGQVRMKSSASTHVRWRGLWSSQPLPYRSALFSSPSMATRLIRRNHPSRCALTIHAVDVQQVGQRLEVQPP